MLEDRRGDRRPVGRLDAVPGVVEEEEPRSGIALASSSPCPTGNSGSAVPWITSVGTEIAASPRVDTAPSISSWFWMDA